MKVVGVRFPDRSMQWVEANAWQIAPLDRVAVDVGGVQRSGVAIVTPGQVELFHARVEGVVVQVDAVAGRATVTVVDGSKADVRRCDLDNR